MGVNELNSRLNLLLVSNTKIPGGRIFFEYCQEEIVNFGQGRKKFLFIPYARPDMITEELYTDKARESFDQMGLALESIIDYNDPVAAVNQAEIIYIGGGNTFMLTYKLQENKLMLPIAKKVMFGIPYLGSSAGSNVAGPNMKTTNDMPIIQPESFDTLGLVPFNINPHYLDPLPIKHAGETREARIKEFIALNNKPVVGLREGTMLRVESGEIVLKGNADYLEGKPGARVFLPSSKPTEPEIRECNLGDKLNFVLPYCV